jgi:hypothetical protein
MPDKKVRSIDPLGIVALANILKIQGLKELAECSCELKCACENQCSCELKCVTVCSCEMKPVQPDMLEVLSNPAFREIVKGLDIKKLKTIDDFLSLVEEIRTKMNVSEISPPSADAKKT